jgi:hypothetical protein
MHVTEKLNKKSNIIHKIVVKFNTSYNKQISSEYEVSSLSEFDEILKKLKENVI